MRPLVVKHGGLTKRETRSINNYFNELNKFDILSPNEEMELATLAAAGDEKAKEKLINHNLRFVVSVAKQYETVNHKVEYLINEGNLGLIVAANNFDPTRGFKFISYAVWHIRQKILSYLKESNLMRIPVNKSTSANKIKKLLAQHLVENDQIPMGYEEETEFLLGEGFRGGDITFYRSLHTIKPVSLDAPLIKDDSDSGDLIAMLEDPNSDKPEANLEYESEVIKRQELLFNTLNSIERFVIEKTFGFNGYESSHVNQIGSDLGMTGERVRQIKNKALTKMRRKLKGNAEWMVMCN
jgi:RNA polymerase primary sigma factor